MHRYLLLGTMLTAIMAAGAAHAWLSAGPTHDLLALVVAPDPPPEPVLLPFDPLH